MKASNDKLIKSNFVYPDSTGSMIRTKLRERLIRIAREADIEGLTKLHTLRHTFASQLVMSGAALPPVMNLLGH